MYQITVFHYHLQTGGITQVIGDSVLSILGEAPDLFEITIVSGRAEQSGQFIDSLNRKLKQRGISSRVTGEVCPSIGYIDAMESTPDTDAIKKELLASYGGTIWWVHNYHIGKNPPFTEALTEITREKPEQQIVFHIHDFPEGGRLSNLKRVREQISAPLYPDCPNVRYVVINGRDRDILVNAGITEDRVFLLNNPIQPVEAVDIDLLQVHDKINRWAMKSLPHWHEGGKLILYPVRTIRRKNVLEAALLVNLLDTPANLIVTLPGLSAQETHYSELVARAFSEKLLPGAWAAGTRLDEFETSFTELTRAADLIISSSVQEGFGYLFINSLLWSVPLVARDMDILNGIKTLFSPGESHFYDRLMVPLTETVREELRKSFSHSLASLAETLPEELLTELRTEVEGMVRGDQIDFSFLTTELQYDYLRKTGQSPLVRENLRELNAELVAITEQLLRGVRIKKNSEVQTRFGPAAHTNAVVSLLRSFSASADQVNRKKGGEDEISYRILKSFNHVDYVRPLFFM